MATVSLATVGGHNPAATHLDDVAAIHEVALPLMNEGREIILVPHSYGGIPGCASIEGQTVAERTARGEKGGISSVFFIASFALERKGMSCTDTFAAEADYMDVAVRLTDQLQLLADIALTNDIRAHSES